MAMQNSRRFHLRYAVLLSITLLSICGCNNASIDVDAAYEMIQDEKGMLSIDSVEILTEKFGSPRSPSPAQIEKMRNSDKMIFGEVAAKKKDYSNHKVWGSDTAFIAVNKHGSSVGCKKFGGKPIPAPRN